MSNYAPQPTTPYEKPYHPNSQPKKRRSGCFMGCMIVGILGVVALVATCVGGFFYIQSSVKMEPAQIREIADGMAKTPLNEEFTPMFGISNYFLDMAIYNHEEGGMMMMVYSRIFDMNDKDQLNAQFKSRSSQGGETELEKTELIEKGEETININGKDVEFSFDHTRGADSDRDYWEVMGVFEGTKGNTILMLRVSQESYSKEEVIRRLESIK